VVLRLLFLLHVLLLLDVPLFHLLGLLLMFLFHLLVMGSLLAMGSVCLLLRHPLMVLFLLLLQVLVLLLLLGVHLLLLLLVFLILLRISGIGSGHRLMRRYVFSVSGRTRNFTPGPRSR
jgi:hypothetical protein